MLTPYELMSDKERDLIYEYLKAYSGGANYYNDFDTDFEGLPIVLNEWRKQKSVFLQKLFGGNDLILRRSITYQIPYDDIYEDIRRSINKREGDIYYAIRSALEAYYDAGEDNESTIYYYPTVQYDIMSIDALARNEYTGDKMQITFADGEVYKINPGMKPMKIIHKLLQKMPNPDANFINGFTMEENFEKFRIWHSKFFNQATVDGELCLSIHPLDFMTMSDNDNNWSSCMHWRGYSISDAGDYRAGTLECMNSPYILLAYLHNPKHTMIGKNMESISEDWEWNSKRWRELFIVHEDCITEIKGYPYQDEQLTNAVLMWIKDLAHNNLGWDYDEKEIDMSNPINLPEAEIVITPQPTYFMYNDFGTLKLHRGRINQSKLLDFTVEKWWKRRRTNRDNTTLIYVDLPYGGEATCMHCGRYLDEMEENQDRVVCHRCVDMPKCPYCGEYYNPDEGYYVADYDSPICEDCYQESSSYDELNDESYIVEGNVINLELRKPEADADPDDDNVLGWSICTCDPKQFPCSAYHDMFSENPTFDTKSWMYYITADKITNLNLVCRHFHLSENDKAYIRSLA